jgi:hypothetical protein
MQLPRCYSEQAVWLLYELEFALVPYRPLANFLWQCLGPIVWAWLAYPGQGENSR